MKKVHSFIVALASTLFLSSSAHALLLIDGFGDNQGPVTDVGAGDGISVIDGPMAVTDTDLSNVARTIESRLTTTDGVGAQNQLTTGTGGGVYEHSQTSGEEGWSLISWTFDSISLSDPVNIIVSVFDIDLTADISLTLVDGGGGSSTDTKTISSIGSFILSFSGAGVDLSDIVAASLLIDGTNTKSLDLSLDFIAVPEPATLALFGMGLLLAFGVSATGRRQRKLAR